MQGWEMEVWGVWLRAFLTRWRPWACLLTAMASVMNMACFIRRLLMAANLKYQITGLDTGIPGNSAGRSICIRSDITVGW